MWNKRIERNFLQQISDKFKKSPEVYNSIKVSVIMPSYNRAYCIANAINSVVLQSHTNWELFIVDDGSTDGLAEVVNEFNDERIIYLRKEWGGVSSARNLGLDHATGDYIFFLDTDNTWAPDYLRNMIVFMKSGNLDCSYSGVKILNDQNKIVGYYGGDFNWRECLDLNHIDINSFGNKFKPEGQDFRFDESLKRLVDWDYILAITALHRTAYAPFLGVDYYDGHQGNRITFTELQGEELSSNIRLIQNKYVGLVDDIRTSDKEIRPHWKQILQ